jgi:hypothetical protein
MLQDDPVWALAYGELWDALCGYLPPDDTWLSCDANSFDGVSMFDDMFDEAEANREFGGIDFDTDWLPRPTAEVADFTALAIIARRAAAPAMIAGAATGPANGVASALRSLVHRLGPAAALGVADSAERLLIARCRLHDTVIDWSETVIQESWLAWSRALSRGIV